jgi:hypothetical protein
MGIFKTKIPNKYKLIKQLMVKVYDLYDDLEYCGDNIETLNERTTIQKKINIRLDILKNLSIKNE